MKSGRSKEERGLERIRTLFSALLYKNLEDRQGMLNTIDSEIESLRGILANDKIEKYKKAWWEAEQIVSISIFRGKTELSKIDEEEICGLVRKICDS